MSEILQGLFFCICGAWFFFCAVYAMSICVRTGQISREEERAGAAPGGASSLHHHFQCPDASGSKLSVRASYQSVHSNQVQSVQSPGGRLD